MLALVLLLGLSAWQERRNRGLNEQLAQLKQPRRATLELQGFAAGETLELELVRGERLWQRPDPPWRRRIEIGDGSESMGIPAGSFTLRRISAAEDETSWPLLALPGQTLRVDGSPPPEGFLRIPAGPFFAELTHECQACDESYLIAEAETTIGEYRAFLIGLAEHYGEASGSVISRQIGLRPFSPWCSEEERAASPDGCPGHRPDSKGIDHWRGLDRPAQRDAAVRYVNWFDALAYCRFRSAKEGQDYRLPSAKEWEKAGRGVDGRPFPWGFQANHRSGGGVFDVVRSAPELRSPYGAYGMASGLAEWTASFEGAFRRRVVGRSWDLHSDRVHLGYGVGEDPWFRSPALGFRIARDR